MNIIKYIMGNTSEKPTETTNISNTNNKSTNSTGSIVNPVNSVSDTNTKNNINSIIVTHNARLRCLITKFFNNSSVSGDLNLKTQFKKYRWQNCCVLKLILKPSSSSEKSIDFNLYLIHSGEISPDENKSDYKYWDIEDKEQTGPNQNNYRFNRFNELTGSIDMEDLKDTNMESTVKNLKNTFTFYLVRHGQAEHNLYSKMTVIRKTDTSLTVNGKAGTAGAGVAINDDLEKMNDDLKKMNDDLKKMFDENDDLTKLIDKNDDLKKMIDKHDDLKKSDDVLENLNNDLDDNPKIKLQYYFASDLIRTRQTLGGILSNINSKYLNSNTTTAKIINVVILPCSHELGFDKTGQCDSTSGISPPENNMSCTNYATAQKFNDCISFNIDSLDRKNMIVNLDWSYYSRFYDKSYRGNITKKYGSKRKCRDTSMIEESIQYINSKNSTIGGKKNRRKTKKYKKRTSKSKNKSKSKK